ncbi:2-acyl-glycerophospho-ethanolamine acyltransferase [Candidatus Scalindua japonica]|uniref:2-acyl-glycerophospho-ethanolamine acyltransferase n=1 Tax=Candidatus Scalindua japonica TaxID=1284222 RepID=A0A286TYC8_9BACT|nr:AMP-binding protein [Candidatus Scalindua japonica]GAX60880.1 2-acyl-glycerophospho-ethanolamine acyltransferase [Candidatus Scalindua japonica]
MIIESFIKTAKKNFNKIVHEDSTGIALTFGQTLTAGILLSRHVRNFEGDNIALVFPASVGGALAFIATTLSGKTPVGLNFIAGKEEQDWVLDTCDIKTIFTSRVFIQKAKIDEDPRMVFIEDIKEKTSKLEKMMTYFSCKIRSSHSLVQKYKELDAPDKPAIILFTSGSESKPKGVPLTNKNIYVSIRAFSTVFQPKLNDKVLGTLPFFHVFGFIACLWLPLIMGMGAVFHPNPTDYERIGRIVHRNRVTMLLGTSTLYRGFMKRWKREQVSSVRLAFAGAEKLNESVRKKFGEKLGITIFEAYGVTESCSCITVNYPDDFCHGSVGRLMPDVQCKIVNTETYEELQPGNEGLILIKGPNVMNGYYKAPELTEQAFHDGFYITGDIGKIENGFLFITDRLKRFAKIGGEMIPLAPIEDKLSNVLDQDTENEKRSCAIVNIPHSQKGEQLVAFVVDENPDKISLNSELDQAGLPKLSQPDHYISIDSIPMLPSGKVDYKSIKKSALEKFERNV